MFPFSHLGFSDLFWGTLEQPQSTTKTARFSLTELEDSQLTTAIG